MSCSDNGSPTAARMLMSVHRFEGAGVRATASLCTSGDDGAAAACTLGLLLGRATATGAGFGLGCACSGFSGFSAGSRGTSTERHGVLQGAPSAAARVAAPDNAITVTASAMAAKGEDRAVSFISRQM